MFTAGGWKLQCNIYSTFMYEKPLLISDNTKKDLQVNCSYIKTMITWIFILTDFWEVTRTYETNLLIFHYHLVSHSMLVSSSMCGYVKQERSNFTKLSKKLYVEQVWNTYNGMSSEPYLYHVDNWVNTR